MKLRNRSLALLLLCVMLTACFAFAGEAKADYTWYTFKDGEGEKVLGSLDGVDAVFNYDQKKARGITWYNNDFGLYGLNCASYVYKYYYQLYEIWTSGMGLYGTPTSSSGTFDVVEVPEKGDIVRNDYPQDNYSHWTIVYDVDIENNKFSRIQQNCWYSDKPNDVTHYKMACAIETNLSISDSKYTFFRYSGKNVSSKLTITSKVVTSEGQASQDGGKAEAIITVEGKPTTFVSGEEVKGNTTISLTATPQNMYEKFDHWESSNGGTFSNTTSATTFFTMPNAETTVTAVFKRAISNYSASWSNVTTNGAFVGNETVSVKPQIVGTLNVTKLPGAFIHTIPSKVMCFISTDKTAVQKASIANPGSTYHGVSTITQKDWGAAETRAYDFQWLEVNHFQNASGEKLFVHANTNYYFKWVALLDGDEVQSSLGNFRGGYRPNWVNSTITAEPGITDVMIKGTMHISSDKAFETLWGFIGTDEQAVYNATPYSHDGVWMATDDVSGITPGSTSGGTKKYLNETFTAQGTGAYGFNQTLVPNTRYYYKFSGKVQNWSVVWPSKVFTFTTGATADSMHQLSVTTSDGDDSKLQQGASGQWEANAKIKLSANHVDFTGWTSTGGGTFDDPNSPETYYTMPGNDATVTANYTYNLKATPNQLDFGTLTEGYTPIGQTVTIQNTGSEAFTLNATMKPNNFQLKIFSKTTLKPGETATVTIIPDAGLKAGKYDGSFYIPIKEMTYVGALVQVKLTVKASGTNPSMKTPPVITTASLAKGTVGQSYSQTLTATGDAPITWSVASGSLPNGLTLTSAGQISGTPTAAGSFTFTVKASNGTSPDATKQLTITVAVAPAQKTPPVITTTSLTNGTVGQNYSQTLTATGDAPITWSVASGSLPDGLTLTSAGQISGTPTVDGSFTFTVKASNGTSPDATMQLFIQVDEAASAPAAVPPKTGDSTPLEWLSLAMVLSAGLFVGLSQRRKRKA